MRSFRAKLTIYFDLKYQESILNFIKNYEIKSIHYDIKNIHKHKFYDIYDKNNKHNIYDYCENITLLSLSIFSDELSNINEWLKYIDEITQNKIFYDIYNSVIDIFLYTNERDANSKKPDRCAWLAQNKHKYSAGAVKATEKAWGCRHSRVSKDKKGKR